MSRRGSLSLSINAIVVLILAITILGLGLGFIRNQWDTMNKQFSDVNEKIKSQMIEDMKQSGALLIFDKLDMSVLRGVESEFYMGISNPDANGTATRCFMVLFRCMDALGGGKCDTVGVLSNPVLVGGEQPTGFLGTNGNIADPWFKVFKTVDIAGGDVGIYPVTAQVGSSADTYLIEVDIFQGDKACDKSPTWSLAPWQKKQFYVKVK